MRATSIQRASSWARRASDTPTAHWLARAGLAAREVIYMLIGFAAYALSRLSEAAYGVAGEGKRTGPRLRSLARAVIYAGLAYLTFQVISGAQSSQSGQQQDVTARAMQHPGGRWLVGIAGLIIVIIDAAVSHNPATSGGVDKALLTLRNQPSGPVLLMLVALGVATFGVYGLCEARWRRV